MGALGRRAEELHARARRAGAARLPPGVPPAGQRRAERPGHAPPRAEAGAARAGARAGRARRDPRPLRRASAALVRPRAADADADGRGRPRGASSASGTGCATWIDERREDLLLHRRLVEAWRSGTTPAATPTTCRARAASPSSRPGRTRRDLALTAGEREFLAEARAAADAAARRRTRRRRAILGRLRRARRRRPRCSAAFALVLRGQARDDARLAEGPAARRLGAGEPRASTPS